MTVEDLTAALKEYDYFFLDEATDEFVTKYASLFDGDVRAQVLYSVVHNGESVLLTQQ